MGYWTQLLNKVIPISKLGEWKTFINYCRRQKKGTWKEILTKAMSTADKGDWKVVEKYCRNQKKAAFNKLKEEILKSPYPFMTVHLTVGLRCATDEAGAKRRFNLNKLRRLQYTIYKNKKYIRRLRKFGRLRKKVEKQYLVYKNFGWHKVPKAKKY